MTAVVRAGRGPRPPRSVSADRFVISPENIEDPEVLAELIDDLQGRIADLEASQPGESVDFEDVAVSTAGTTVKLSHQMGGRVRYWMTDWVPSAANTVPDIEKDTTNTTANVLVLKSYVAGRLTFRVEKVRE